MLAGARTSGRKGGIAWRAWESSRLTMRLPLPALLPPIEPLCILSVCAGARARIKGRKGYCLG
jgi:hypothetical protein